MSNTTNESERVDATRAQSTVLGVVLLVGLVVVGGGAVLAVGSSAVDETRNAIDGERAERDMVRLDTAAARLMEGREDSVRTSLRGESAVTVDGSAGRLTVRLINDSADTTRTVYDAQLGAVRWDGSRQSVTYQNGAVWTDDDELLSQPEVYYRNSTLWLPTVVVEGDGTHRGAVTFERNGTPTAVFPGSDELPIRRGRVELTVRSGGYEAWGRHFERQTGGAVTYDHSNESVRVEFLAPDTHAPLRGGVTMGTASGTLRIGDQGAADSYNSSRGTYDVSYSANTTIVTAGDLALGNQSTVNGSVEAEGNVTMADKSTVTGDLAYGDALSRGSDTTVSGETSADASVRPPSPVEWLIDGKRELLDRDNDNGDTAAVDESTDRLTGDGVRTLDGGSYYLDGVSLGSDDELVLNTTDGDVDVVVDGDLELVSDAEVRVAGEGTARLYVTGSLRMSDKSNVTVSGDASHRMWMYLRPDATASLANQGRFVGVIYGPGSNASSGVDVSLENQVEVYGGIGGNVSTIPNGVGVHYDEALADRDPVADAVRTPPVSYMHLMVHRVTVS